MDCPVCNADVSDSWECDNVGPHGGKAHLFKVCELRFSHGDNSWVVYMRIGVDMNDMDVIREEFTNVDDAYDYAIRLGEMGLFI